MSILFHSNKIIRKNKIYRFSVKSFMKRNGMEWNWIIKEIGIYQTEKNRRKKINWLQVNTIKVEEALKKR